MPTQDWIVAPARLPETRPLPWKAHPATVFVRKSFEVRREQYVIPRDDIEDAQEPLWAEAAPDSNGDYRFEIGAELPFVLPEPEGPEHVFSQPGYSPDLVLVNRMVRAYFGGGMPDGDGLLYLLGHQRAIAYITEKKGLGDHFPIPMRSFVARTFRGKGKSAKAVLDRALAGWIRAFVHDVGNLVDAYRMADVETMRVIPPVRSSNSLPGMWLAVDSEDEAGYIKCQQLAEEPGQSAFVPRHGMTPTARAEIEATVRGDLPQYPHKLALGSAYTSAHYGDYARAVVDVSTACESLLQLEVWPKVRDRALARGISQKEVDRLLGEDGEKLSYDRLLNYHLYDVFDVGNLDDHADLVKSLNWAREVRNQVVHRGQPKNELVEAKVMEALAAAKALINFVVGLPPNPVASQTEVGLESGSDDE